MNLYIQKSESPKYFLHNILQSGNEYFHVTEFQTELERIHNIGFKEIFSRFGDVFLNKSINEDPSLFMNQV